MNALTDLMSGSPIAYLIVVALVAGDAVVPLVPGESSVVAAAVLAADGDLVIWLVVAAAFAGAFLGDLAMYGLGRWRGQHLIDRYASEGSRAARVEWARRQVARRGTPLVVAAQFVPGGRNVVMILAGCLHFPLRRFLVSNAIGTALWASFQASIGYFGGRLFNDTLVALGVSLAIAFSVGALIELADRARRRMPTT